MSTNVDRAFENFRVRAGDGDLVALLDTCRPVVIRYCVQVLDDREDAEDAAQLVLLEVANHASDMNNAACFGSWLYRVSRARSMDLRRRRTRRENHEARAAAPAATTNGNGSAATGAEARQFLFAALAELPDEDRALVVEHYFEKAPLRTLALRRGCSKVAIWKRLGRVRAALKDRLSRAGLAGFFPALDVWMPEVAAPPGIGVAAPRPVGAAAGSRVGTWAAASAVGILMLTVGMIAGARLNSPRPAELNPGIAVVSSPAPAPPSQIVLSPVPPPAVEPAPELSEESAPLAAASRDEHKERIRLLFRQIQSQRRTSQPISPELALELEPLNDVTRIANRNPSNRPEQFAGFVALLYEVAAEENGIVFSPEDRRRIARLREDLSAALGRVPAGPPPVRLLAAVEADLAFARGMAEIVPRDEAGRMMLSDIDRIVKRGKRKSMPQERLLREIVADWSATLQAEVGVAPLLGQAADRLATALARITEDFHVRSGGMYDEDEYMKNMMDRAPVLPYDPVRRMEYQVEALKAHIDALNAVRNGLDAAQGGRLLNAEPWNYAVSRKGTVIEIRD